MGAKSSSRKGKGLGLNLRAVGSHARLREGHGQMRTRERLCSMENTFGLAVALTFRRQAGGYLRISPRVGGGEPHIPGQRVIALKLRLSSMSRLQAHSPGPLALAASGGGIRAPHSNGSLLILGGQQEAMGGRGGWGERGPYQGTLHSRFPHSSITGQECRGTRRPSLSAP